MDAFSDLAVEPRWVPFRLVWNPKREKFDKVPHNGRHGLSTSDPTNWCNLSLAIEKANEYGLSGVGFVMTSGFTQGDWTLVGLDADDVDDKFSFPFESYIELSPSKTGLRSFIWVPTSWAKRFKDTVCEIPYCKHVEVYFGSAARFLTVTGDAVHDVAIAKLTGNVLLKLEEWGLNPSNPTAPVTLHLINDPGEVFPYPADLSPEQRHLIDGTGQLDRSAVLHGLIIKLVDANRKREDILATLLKTPAIWKYFLDHRHQDPVKALQFAKAEVARAYSKSIKGMQEALIGYNGSWKPEEPVIIADPDLEFPVELYDNARGLVGEIARWVQGASFAPRKEFSYACALSMMACLIGPYCKHGTRDSKCNLYIVLVGGTGTGKNEAYDTMVMLMNQTEAKDCVMDFPASEAALRRQLNVTPNILIRADEFSHKLVSIDRDSSSLGKAILEAYNGARMPMKVYADTKNTLPAVENPFVQILGGSTDKIWEVAKQNHLDDGTLNRFIFVCLKDDPDYQRNFEPNAIVPKQLKDTLNAFWRQGRMNDLIGDVDGFGRKVTYDDEVKKQIMLLDGSVWLLTKQKYGSLYSRFILNTLKVATILAVSAGRDVINMDDFESARKFIKWSIANTFAKIEMHMADNNFHRLSKKLMAELKRCGGKMIMRDAYKLMHITRREMDDVIGMLEMAGELHVVEGETNRNKTVTIWLYIGQKEGDD